MTLHVNYFTPDQLADFAQKGANSLLCLIGYDAPCPDWVPLGCPFSQLALKPLTGVAYEVWSASGGVRYDAARRFAVARTPGLMMALIEAEQIGNQSLSDVSRQTYGKVFDIIEGAEQSLLRIWNYIPDITGEEAGMERYRQFNAGRAQSFQETRGAPAIPPAASGLGSASGDMLIYFLAGDSASTAIENPRQISAYNYPEQYGPRSPTFSRATLVTMASGSMLFISGTASIVGHESQHPNDIKAQTMETIRNLQAVIAEAEKQGFSFSTNRTSLKIYVRHPEHMMAVQRIVEAELPWLSDVIYLNAEICRKELLVEIEAVCSSR